ncbi:septum formation initiator family protein [Limisphaera ngatamarikiensis]|uniref:septum formation initiator family protein n=1 Tax=Limisphaera ngatamarikiensis TaxID=1324935 RepID=UPI00197CFE55
MSAGLGFWERLIRWTTTLLVAAVILGVLTLAAHWYGPVIRQNERMRREILRLDREIRQEEETARQMSAAIRALQEDPKAVERLARERLGLARPGETVIRFEPPATNPPGFP